MLRPILLIILILALLGSVPIWRYSAGWGYGPSGGAGLLLIILIILIVTGGSDGEQHGAKIFQSRLKEVERAMHEEKRGTLKSGKGGKGGTVKSRRQAIAIGLSEARKEGKKVPKKKS